MTRSSARGVALNALQRWRKGNDRGDAIIARSFVEIALSAADRAFALELFYGVLRNLTLLDFWIAQLRPAHIDVDVRDILRLGLYQLFRLEIPEHAAVNETVGLAAARGRKVVNAVLRAAVRRRNELRSLAAALIVSESDANNFLSFIPMRGCSPGTSSLLPSTVFRTRRSTTATVMCRIQAQQSPVICLIPSPGRNFS